MWRCCCRASPVLLALVLLGVSPSWGVGGQRDSKFEGGVVGNGVWSENSGVGPMRNLLQSAKNAEESQRETEFANIGKELKVLIDNGDDVNARVGSGGNTPLVLASYAGLEELVQKLIEMGADVNGTIDSGYSPLVVAARGNHQKTAEILINAKADVDQKSNTGLSAIWWAAYRGNDELVEMLLDAGADPTSSSNGGASALLMATQEGHVDVVGLLVAAGADVNARSDKGSSPLMISVQYTKQNKENHVEICGLLLDGGADPNTVKPGSRQTVLWIASYMKDPETTALLVKAGADVDREAQDGSTPLYVATIRNCVGCMEALLEGGAPPNPTYSSTDWTPLHAASALGHKEAVKVLLDNKADKNLRDAKKRRPIDVIGIEGEDLSEEKRQEIKTLLDDGLRVENEDVRDGTKPARKAETEETSLPPEKIVPKEVKKADEEKPETEEKDAAEKPKPEPKPKEEKKEPKKEEPEKTKEKEEDKAAAADTKEKPAEEPEKENGAEKADKDKQQQPEKPEAGEENTDKVAVGFRTAAPIVGEAEVEKGGFRTAAPIAGVLPEEEVTTRGASFPMWSAWIIIIFAVLCCCVVAVIFVCRRRRRQQRRQSSEDLARALSAPDSSSRISDSTNRGSPDVEQGGEFNSGGDGAPSRPAEEDGEHSNPIFGRDTSGLPTLQEV